MLKHLSTANIILKKPSVKHNVAQGFYITDWIHQEDHVAKLGGEASAPVDSQRGFRLPGLLSLLTNRAALSTKENNFLL